MERRRSAKPLDEAVREVLADREMSMRALATEAEVHVGHLSKILGGKKRLTDDLLTRLTAALDLPADYFAEARERWLYERIRRDPKLRDRLYDQLNR